MRFFKVIHIGGQRGGGGGPSPPPLFTKIGLKRQPRGSIFQNFLEHIDIWNLAPPLLKSSDRACVFYFRKRVKQFHMSMYLSYLYICMYIQYKCITIIHICSSTYHKNIQIHNLQYAHMIYTANLTKPNKNVYVE